jgi:catechol 2,3-dioxygenase-like lactoylglutathione lyase family enzyme
MPLLTSASIMAFTATANADRAREFYRDRLGLKLVEEQQFALVFDAGGAMLRVQKVNEVREAHYTTLGWQVPDVAATVDELEKAGVKFERHNFPGVDEKGIWTPPGSTTKIAWFKDPDGNILSLTQL